LDSVAAGNDEGLALLGYTNGWIEQRLAYADAV